METDLIIVSEYCQKSHVEPSFIGLLYREGLIDIREEEGMEYLLVSQLQDLERYSRMYYELSINIEGIDAIRHLLDRMNAMRNEINCLKSRLIRYERESGAVEYE